MHDTVFQAPAKHHKMKLNIYLLDANSEAYPMPKHLVLSPAALMGGVAGMHGSTESYRRR
jgi:hypothetical protein